MCSTLMSSHEDGEGECDTARLLASLQQKGAPAYTPGLGKGNSSFRDASLDKCRKEKRRERKVVENFLFPWPFLFPSVEGTQQVQELYFGVAFFKSQHLPMYVCTVNNYSRIIQLNFYCYLSIEQQIRRRVIIKKVLAKLIVL